MTSKTRGQRSRVKPSLVVNVAGVYSEHGRPDAVRDLQEILAACREATNRPMNG
ncbi:hypothetical protein [Streptomyces sp. NPDC086989]|uniref:hypothetical protein n=1 Tax=Streptomyces sp. NPDC086989 TaxID=3365764 RepID=UPI0038172FC2